MQFLPLVIIGECRNRIKRDARRRCNGDPRNIAELSTPPSRRAIEWA
jgi:hypothetical protein